jgi:hypothetical protein
MTIMNKYLTAFYLDEEDLIEGLGKIKAKGIKVDDVLTPFPVHGLDKVLELKRSRLTKVAFAGGVIGGLVGFFFQAWVFTSGYAINFGGKPYFAVPSFIPVTFELTILFAAFSMVIAFFVYYKLGPGAKALVHDERVTDDRFLLVIRIDEEETARTEEIKNILQNAGAQGITIKM